MNSDTLLIPLSSGKAHAIVDACAFEFLNQWNWQLSDKGYAVRKPFLFGKSYVVWMHRVISSPPEGVLIDHINLNRLDNRLDNLRFATHSGNVTNRGPNKERVNDIQYKGVYKNGKYPTYSARMTLKIDDAHRHVYLGSFKTQEEAAMAYDREALKRFGEFAKLNFPERMSEY